MAKFTCNFISYTLQRTVDITVIIPSVTIPESMDESLKHTHVPEKKFPVLYLLHGFGNNHAQWTGYSNVELYAEERRIAVVMFSAENKSYVKVGGDDFFRFVSEELPEFVTAMFPISKKPQHTYIAGLSMGGYGSFVHALNHPERFAALGAFSAGIRINPARLSGGADAAVPAEYDLRALSKGIAERGEAFPKMYIACGEQDFLYADNNDFREVLTALGADVTWVSVPGYGHEWRFWDMQVEAFLDWIPRTDIYANSKRKV